jgi:CheY-like chemotaxis protein
MMLRGRLMMENYHSAIPPDRTGTTPDKAKTGPTAIRVLLADDSQIMRKAIAHILSEDPEIQVVAEAVSFGQTIELANKLKPQVIVMDLHMGEGDIEPSQVKSSLASSRVLAVSLWSDPQSQALAESFGAVTLMKKTDFASPDDKKACEPCRALKGDQTEKSLEVSGVRFVNASGSIADGLWPAPIVQAFRDVRFVCDGPFSGVGREAEIGPQVFVCFSFGSATVPATLHGSGNIGRLATVIL